LILGLHLAALSVPYGVPMGFPADYAIRGGRGTSRLGSSAPENVALKQPRPFIPESRNLPAHVMAPESKAAPVP